MRVVVSLTLTHHRSHVLFVCEGCSVCAHRENESESERVNVITIFLPPVSSQLRTMLPKSKGVPCVHTLTLVLTVGAAFDLKVLCVFFFFFSPFILLCVWR